MNESNRLFSISRLEGNACAAPAIVDIEDETDPQGGSVLQKARLLDAVIQFDDAISPTPIKIGTIPGDWQRSEIRTPDI